MRERRKPGIIYLMLVFMALLIGANIFWIWRYGALRNGYDVEGSRNCGNLMIFSGR